MKTIVALLFILNCCQIAASQVPFFLMETRAGVFPGKVMLSTSVGDTTTTVSFSTPALAPQLYFTGSISVFNLLADRQPACVGLPSVGITILPFSFIDPSIRVDISTHLAIREMHEGGAVAQIAVQNEFLRWSVGTDRRFLPVLGAMTEVGHSWFSNSSIVIKQTHVEFEGRFLPRQRSSWDVAVYQQLFEGFYVGVQIHHIESIEFQQRRLMASYFINGGHQ